MLNNKIRRVIVADNDQALGIITVTDFVKHLNTIVAETENYPKDLYENLFDEYEYWNN